MHLVLRKLTTDGMYPTLERGQYVVVLKTTHLNTNDIIVFARKGKECVKRVAGVEGGFLYVLGDNPRYSTDSRQYGYIGRESVIGRVIWPRTDR